MIGTIVSLAVVYLGLIAAIMSYATLTIEFSQSVKNDEAALAILESQYLAKVAQIQHTDYQTIGYAIPQATRYVPGTSVTALR
jgi:hypothetical protein